MPLKVRLKPILICALLLELDCGPCLAATNQTLLSIALNTQSFPVFTWTRQNNYVYDLESRPDLTTGTWTVVAVTNLNLSLTGNATVAIELQPRTRSQFYRLRGVPSNRFGAHTSAGGRPDIPRYLNDLGASWARVNAKLDGDDPPFSSFLDAGINLVITFGNRDPSNVLTNYGGLADWPSAGFPFRSATDYQRQIRNSLAPLLPYRALGRQIWLQCENEVGDAALSTNIPSKYWRGTTDQYLTQMAAFYEVAHSYNPPFPAVLSSFTSKTLEVLLDPSDPQYVYQTNRVIRLLTQGQYDATDLHFYDCVSSIRLKIQWIKNHLPPGKLWISTENGGPDPVCPTTPQYWYDNQPMFEQVEAQQVPARLSACATNGASVSLWFSLFDLTGEVDQFNHLGLLDRSVTPPRKKPAYEAFKSFTKGK